MEQEQVKKEVDCRINLRLPKTEKPFYEFQLKKFCDFFDSDKIKSIEFGKQDTRGTESICFFDYKGCISYQKHFYNKYELLGFVCGFNECKNDYYFTDILL